ncbi:MAG TPA: PPOX class F420-dependent oxidoreductase [Mycobacteriales bacterium]|jgi:PPOX class probable F420-dependent enzyme|nr:PPOX class F420-dependent oxidoreductase [Mycobacteriales bacterium]
METSEALDFIREHHHAVLATMRADGAPQLTPVTAGVDADGEIVVSSRETAAKVRNLRRDPRASLCVFTERFFGEFVQVEGMATIVSLPDAMDGLVDYYRSISGEHPDWDDYRDTMIRDHRVLVTIDPSRVGPSYSG